jgi:hypothetical protein
MKKKIELLIAYFKGIKTQTVELELSFDEQDHYIDFEYGDYTVPVPTSIKSVFQDIVEHYLDELVSESNYGSDTGYYTIKVRVLPKEKKVKLILFGEMYGEHNDSYSKELTPNDNLSKYMQQNEIDFVSAKYYGGGDNGYIEDVYADGKPNNSNDLEFLLYGFLDSAFSGWEIDDGSSGKIEATREQILIEHEWQTKEPEEINEMDLTIDEN